MERRFRIFLKMGAAIALAFLFIWIIYTDETRLQLTQPEGEPVKAEDVAILTEELLLEGVQPKDHAAYEQVMQTIHTSGDGPQYITYETYCALWQALLGDLKDISKDGAERLKELQDKLSYEKRYRKDFFLLKKDWYASYDRLLVYYGLQETIRKEKVEILCGPEKVAGKRMLPEGVLLASDGREFTYLSQDFAAVQYTPVMVYLRDNRLLTLTESLENSYQLSNVWLMESDKEGIHFFYKDYELLAGWNQTPQDPKAGREQVADIVFFDGKVEKINIKQQRISGKLIRLSENEAEIEGHGTLMFAEEYKGYRLYEELVEAGAGALTIGYDFADFVIEDGKICSFLLLRKEEMESIRVLLKNNGFGSIYHEQAKIRCKEEMILTYGPYGDRKDVVIPAGDVVTLTPDSDYLKGDRVEVMPVTQSGKLEITSLTRSQGTPAYRGSLEITSYENGLVLVNEVLLEEYLYSVVPSEMPASYPVEALKAQAVCARTYAYRYLQKPGFGSLGAHVDDSTGYQVYNNIEENVDSTKAVKETSGELLLYEEKPATTYYYSTSCGYGADERVWQEIPEPELPYLQPVNIAADGRMEAYTPEELTEEECFAEYISHIDENSFEKEEAWYRWNCEVEVIDVEAFARRLKERYQAGQDKILTMKDKEEFVSEIPADFTEIYDIRCVQRLPGGVMNELIIETDQGIYKVISEYNIRYILNQSCEILRQDGSAYSGGLLLPSAYMVVEPVQTQGLVTGYRIKGGGYGHGAGMSQNGAKAMAAAGKNTEEILTFFFDGCQLEKVY